MAAFSSPDPGQLRTRIDIRRQVERGRDADGYPIVAEEKIATVHARWDESIGSDEGDRAQAAHRRSATVDIRWRDGIEPGCTVVRCGEERPWEVVGVAALTGPRSWLRLTVAQEVSR